MADESIGVDASTIGDIDPTFNPIRGNTIVLQRVIRRWITARGVLSFAPDEGADLMAWINEAATPEVRLMLATYLLVETKKDEAVTDAVIALNFNASTRSLEIRASIETDEGAFDFTVAIGELGIELLRANT